MNDSEIVGKTGYLSGVMRRACLLLLASCVFAACNVVPQRSDKSAYDTWYLNNSPTTEKVRLNIGKRFWLKSGSGMYQFKALPKVDSDLVVLTDVRWIRVDGLMVDEGIPYAQFSLNNGKRAYLRANDFSPVFFLTEDPVTTALERKDDELRSAQLAEEKWKAAEEPYIKQLLAAMSSAGYQVGDTIWTTSPKGHVGAFVELRINGVTVKKEPWSTDPRSSQVEIMFSTLRGEKVGIPVDAKSLLYAPERELRGFARSPPAELKRWSRRVVSAIQDRQVFRGMTADQAQAAWGPPQDINRTTGVWGVDEQWVYASRSYLYFRNGVLTTIQN